MAACCERPCHMHGSHPERLCHKEACRYVHTCSTEDVNSCAKCAWFSGSRRRTMSPARACSTALAAASPPASRHDSCDNRWLAGNLVLHSIVLPWCRTFEESAAGRQSCVKHGLPHFVLLRCLERQSWQRLQHRACTPATRPEQTPGLRSSVDPPVDTCSHTDTLSVRQTDHDHPPRLLCDQRTGSRMQGSSRWSCPGQPLVQVASSPAALVIP